MLMNGLGYIHILMKYTNNCDLAGVSLVIDNMTGDREFSITRLDVIAGPAKPGILGQLMKHAVKLSQVFVTLLYTPMLLRIFGNACQITLGCVSELKAGQHSMVIVVQFIDKSGKRIVGYAAFFAFIQ